MNRVKFETSDTPEIIIEDIDGSLRIKGWDNPKFQGDADQDDSWDINQDGDVIKLSCSSGCLLRVPEHSKITIGSVAKELMIKSIVGEIVIDEIDSQVNLKNIGKISIKTINGNLIAKHIDGDLNVNSANGNAVIRDVSGDLTMGENLGNLNFRGFVSNMDVKSEGNVALSLEPETGGNFKVTAEGNIYCKVAPDTSAKVKLISDSESIRIKSPEFSQILKQEKYELEIGEGESKLTLEAEGRIDFISYSGDDLFGEEFDFEFEENFANLADEITQQVTDQIESQMDSLTSHLDQLTTGLAFGTASGDRSRRKINAKRAKLERKLSQAQRKIERKARAATAKKRAYASRYSRGKPSDPVSDEERKTVLEMLQNNLINVEEAETLLAALEGREPDLPNAPPPPDVSNETPELPEIDEAVEKS